MTQLPGHIVAIGAGGFAVEPDNPLLDDFILSLARRQPARVCFIPTASGDSPAFIAKFYRTFSGRCIPTDLTLFDPDPLPRHPWTTAELPGFVEPPSLPDAARMAAARDPNDAPYFELQVGIDAAAVYTDDPDLRGMGAPVVSRAALTAARDFARAASISFSLRISGVVLLTAGVATIQTIVGVLRGGLRAARRLPDWVQVILLAAAFVMLMNPHSRKWLRERLGAMGPHAWAVMRELMPIVMTAMEQTSMAKGASEKAWSEVNRELPERAGLPSQPLHVHVLTASVRAARPLTTDEIAQAVVSQGYRGGAPPSRDYLLRILRAHPTLTRTADMRWHTRAV